MADQGLENINIGVTGDINIEVLVVGCGRGETNMDVCLSLMLQLKFVAAHVLGVASPNSLWSGIYHTQLC